MMPIEFTPLWQQSDKRCTYCERELHPRKATRDHVIPRARGGANGDNLVISCRPCNIAKGDMTADEFEASEWLAERRREIEQAA